jgi:cytochrome c
MSTCERFDFTVKRAWVKVAGASALLGLASCAVRDVQSIAPQLGEAVSPQALVHVQVAVGADGTRLPKGSGNAIQGADVFARHCAACHGSRGEGGSAEELVGGKQALDSASPDRTIGRYWPFATTLFDYIRRAMPPNAPGSLTDDEVYAVSAWLLNKEGLIASDVSLNAQTLPQVTMPNRNGFVRDVPGARTRP